METRYQVFLSSTFDDLEEARREVSAALLKTDCFPSGMELFPAADLEQFEYIKQVINSSDYFLIVSAGKYGSIHPETDLSYTEMEYDYALEIGKPIIRLLHKDPFNGLTGNHIEKSDEGKEKLRILRKKLADSKLVTFWNDPKELGQATILALLDIIKRYPSAGWVRGENALTVETMKELERLRARQVREKPKNSETPVSFEELSKEIVAQVYVADAGEDEDPKKKCGSTKVKANKVAESVFLSLISSSYIHQIGAAASESLSLEAKFSKKQSSYAYYWLELELETVEHILHYLESRGLVRWHGENVLNPWQLTQRGRLHATYVSSRKHLM